MRIRQKEYLLTATWTSCGATCNYIFLIDFTQINIVATTLHTLHHPQPSKWLSKASSPTGYIDILLLLPYTKLTSPQWLPVLASVVWLSMLLGMLLHWIINTNSRHYPSMRRGQHIAFISDIGAQELKPMFITMCAVCTVLFDLSFAAEMWLRKKGRLAPNKSMGEKVLMAMTIVFAIVGTAGLILLAIFDTLRHNTLHNIFLLLFIGGYWISAIFICAEYQRLGISMSTSSSCLAAPSETLAHMNHRVPRTPHPPHFLLD